MFGMFGKLFSRSGGQSEPAPSPAPVQAPARRGAFGRFFGQYDDGSQFLDRALAGAAILQGDYASGAEIRRDAAERFRERKKAEEARARQEAYARTYSGLGVPQMPQSPQIQIPQIQVSQNPVLPARDAGPQFDPVTGREIEQATVIGERLRGAAEADAPQVPRMNLDDLVNLHRRNAQLAAQNGDLAAFQDFMGKADAVAKAAREQQSGMAAAVFAPILQAGGSPEQQTAAIQDAVGYLQRQGVTLDRGMAEALADPATRATAMRQLINAGSPQKAAEGAIALQNTPFQRDDSGTNLMSFDPRTGQYIEGPAKGVDPSRALAAQVQVRGQDVSAQTQRAGQAVTRRGQDMTESRARRNEQLDRTRLPSGFILNGN